MGTDVVDGLDMRLTKDQYDALYGDATGRSALGLYVPWTNGIIPYKIQSGDFNTAQIRKIEQGMANWENMTCIKFKRANDSDRHSIIIKDLGRCWSYLGMRSSETQELSLAAGCFWRGTVEHELGHAIGLVHEHQRPNRHNNICVLNNNIREDSKDQLIKKYLSSNVHKYGLPYDYTSVMHYGQYAFSKYIGKLQTIKAINDPHNSVTKSLGKALWASFYDVQLVNTMYNCNASCPAVKCGRDCFVDKHCRCFCKNDMPEVPCTDIFDNCTTLSDDNCWRNRNINEIYCRKRCGLCAVPGTTVPPEYPQLPKCTNWNLSDGCMTSTPTTAPPPPASCEDYHKKCPIWAGGGWCRLSFNYMNEICKKSCGLCEC